MKMEHEFKELEKSLALSPRQFALFKWLANTAPSTMREIEAATGESCVSSRLASMAKKGWIDQLTLKSPCRKTGRMMTRWKANDIMRAMWTPGIAKEEPVQTELAIEGAGEPSRTELAVGKVTDRSSEGGSYLTLSPDATYQGAAPFIAAASHRPRPSRIAAERISFLVLSGPSGGTDAERCDEYERIIRESYHG